MNYRTVLENILAVFDLSRNCKEIYIKSFELGEQSIGKLAENSNMDRSSAYLAVEQLKETGLLEVDETRRPMIIRAVEPRKLVGRIERRIQSLEEAFDTTHTLLPQLEAAYGAKNFHPIMQAYNGKDGLQQIMEDILSENSKEILIFTNQEAERKVFTRHDHAYFIRKRKQNNVFARVIAANDSFAQELLENDKRSLRSTKIIDSPPPFTCEVYIYGDKIAMLSFRDEIIGFIVNSSDFAQLLRWQFEMIWSSL
jgi:sugar-specific transcriptional regulator TrmB